MNYFATFVTAFCSGCIMIGTLHLLCPEGTMAKSVKYVLSLVFLIVIISAARITIKQADIKFNSVPPEIVNSDELNTTAAEYVYSSILKNAGINFTKITVCTDKTEDGSIIISKVIIYSDCDAIKIKQALGIIAENYEVEVINE